MSRPPIAPLYLPVTAATAAAFFDDGRMPEAPIERAALYAVLTHLQAPQGEAALQALIRQLQTLFAAQPAQGQAALSSARAQQAGMSAAAIRRALAQAAMTYAPDELMLQQAWQGADGLYDFAFQARCRQMLTPMAITLAAPAQQELDEPLLARRQPARQLPGSGTRDQQVTASVIAAGDGEHVAVQAYAGTGKTWLIHQLTTALGNGFTYIAPSDGHLYGFRQATATSGTAVRAVHLWGLAHALARQHARQQALDHVPQRVQATYSLAEQARQLGQPGIGHLAPAQVVALCQRIVKGWCHTDSPQLGLRDVLRVVPGAGPDAAALLAASLRLWEQMFVRHRVAGHLYTVDIVHLAKWLMVTGAQIPASYGTLLIDEAHDLQPAWRHLFAGYAGGCVQLGDPNQQLRGSWRQSPRSKQVWMGQSVRIGNGVEGLVTAALQLGGNDPMAGEFAASRAHITARRAYEDSARVPDGGLHVHGDPQALLERLLGHRDTTTDSWALLPATQRVLRTAALALIDSHRQWQAGSQRRWPAQADRLRQSGLSRLAAQVESGWSLPAVDALLAGTTAPTDADRLYGLVEHAKNLEADVVTLAPCCFEQALAERQLHPARAVYQAITRARHELWLPGDGMDRLRDRLG